MNFLKNMSTFSTDYENHIIPSAINRSVKSAISKCFSFAYCVHMSIMTSQHFFVVPNELMLCNNVHCTVHNHNICDLYHRIIDACLKTGECIPSTAPSKQNNIPGWDDHVETNKRKPLHGIGSGKLKVSLTVVMWLK